MAETDEFYIKRGDLLPTLDATLIGPDGEPVDLTSALSVTFKMKKLSTLYIDAACNVTDQSQAENHGKVRYTWQPGDTDLAGSFKAEFEVIWASGTKPETYPNDSYATIVITKDLD